MADTLPRDTQRMASKQAPSNKRERRTQAERRAATRTALLDAAIECLVEQGYARTTTRRIAGRAGVTPGALQHHFASKAELLGETIGHIRAKVMEAVFAQGAPSTSSMRKRHEQLLDRMWRIYRGPLFVALLELAIGARTDPERRKHAGGAHDELTRWNEMAALVVYPEHAGRPEPVQLIASAQAMMRGLALMGLAGEADPDRVWPTTREHILAMSAHVLGEPGLAP
jgi:AcrR family transcriptional regulator